MDAVGILAGLAVDALVNVGWAAAVAIRATKEIRARIISSELSSTSAWRSSGSSVLLNRVARR